MILAAMLATAQMMATPATVMADGFEDFVEDFD